VTGYLRHVAACNRPCDEVFVPWRVGGRVVGWVRESAAGHLRGLSDVFVEGDDGFELHPAWSDFDARSEALAGAARAWSAAGLVPPLMDEPYPVTDGGRDAALCTVDRAVAPLLGIRSFGQHLNGFVRRADGIHMWLGRRARDRLLFPGRLDNMVAGGLPYHLPLAENLVKECREEADVPEELARQAVPVGMISYNRVTERGYRPDILYCYDLELPADFEPRNTDGEVAEFLLLPLAEVARIVHDTDDFKLNCNLVVVDFLVRHGWLGPDHADYVELVQGLRRPLLTPGGVRGPAG
jgi:8-oxo-dGTP pyrophosphatase MutT (NUDIX family)